MHCKAIHCFLFPNPSGKLIILLKNDKLLVKSISIQECFFMYMDNYNGKQTL